MNTVFMKTHGRFIERESLNADEYDEEVTYPGSIPNITPTGSGLAALFNRCANDAQRSSFPNIDLPCDPVVAAAFPKCP